MILSFVFAFIRRVVTYTLSRFTATACSLLLSAGMLASAPANANSDEPLIIALSADLSAVAVEGGVAIERGARIAIDEINAKGGILGRRIALKVFDHRGNPARGKKNLSVIAQTPNVLAVLGGVHTPVALAELPLLHEHQIIYLGPWAAGTPIVDNGYTPNFVFRISVRDAEAAKVLLKHAMSRGIKRISLVLERTAWGRSNLNSLQLLSKEFAIEIVNVNWINWRQQDFSQSVSIIAKSDAEAVFTVVNAPEGKVVVDSLLASGLDLPIISHWGLAGGAFVEQLGLDKLNQADINVLQTFSLAAAVAGDKAAQVLTAYREKFDRNATKENILGVVGMAHAYDLVHLLALATAQVNSTDSDKIRQGLEQLPEYKGLIKTYQPAFTEFRHDALFADDYFMATFNKQGHLTPYKRD